MIASIIALVVGAGVMLASTWLANFVYAFRVPPEEMTEAGKDDAHRLGATVGFVLALVVIVAIISMPT